MKKLCLFLMLFFIFNIEISLASVLTIMEDNVTVQYDKTPNKVVTLTTTNNNIIGWEVLEGNVTVTNNQFVMPITNVTIKPIYRYLKYLLIVEDNVATSGGLEQQGNIINVTAVPGSMETFINWTANGIMLTPEQLVSPNISFTMPGGQVKLVANYNKLNSYTISYHGNGGTANMDSQVKIQGKDILISEGKPKKDWNTFLGWNTDMNSNAVQYQAGDTFTTDNSTTLYAVWLQRDCNEPKLAEGLTPVNWDGDSWEETDEKNWDYNYQIAAAGHNTVAGDGTGMWANAIADDGSLYVWIPRYTYKISQGEHSNGNSWSSATNAGNNKIEIKFSRGTVDDTTGSYNVHPAFLFGGGEGVEGIWVSKYEISRNNATADSEGSGTTIVSKPGVRSLNAATVSQMYDYAYSYNRDLESHMMKNSEWGAVAYLTNAVGKIPFTNNSKITGTAGSSQNDTESSGVNYSWDTSGGVKASTTHNVYGIYDMSGGSYEYVAAFVDNGHSNLTTYASSLIENRNTEYVDVYPMGDSDSNANNYNSWSNIKGDAVYETSNNSSGAKSWDTDQCNAPRTEYPIFSRGGDLRNGQYAGIFNFSNTNGKSNNGAGFHAVLIVKD